MRGSENIRKRSEVRCKNRILAVGVDVEVSTRCVAKIVVLRLWSLSGSSVYSECLKSDRNLSGHRILIIPDLISSTS